MECVGCGRFVDPVWCWCPDCGGSLRDDAVVDLRLVDRTPYVVDWATDPMTAEAS